MFELFMQAQLILTTIVFIALAAGVILLTLGIVAFDQDNLSDRCVWFGVGIFAFIFIASLIIKICAYAYVAVVGLGI